MVMDRILQFIEEHLEEELNVQQLCEIAGYSESHFIRKFKEYTNQTVMAMLFWRDCFVIADQREILWSLLKNCPQMCGIL